MRVGELEESADMSLGVHQLSSLKLTLRDDTSTYSYGFWFKVLSGETHIRIYLNQGGSDLFYFFGIIQADTVVWGEEYIGSSRIRTVSFDLVDMAGKIMETLTADWSDDVIANSVYTNNVSTGSISYVIKVTGLFAAMLKTSGLNSTYALTDVSFVFNDVDMKFLVGASEYNLSEIYAPTRYYDGVSDTDNALFQNPGGGIAAQYAKLGGLLPDLLKTCGVILRMSYDTSSERHLIQLIQRGRAYSATLDFEGREKSSTIRKSFDLLGDAVRCAYFDALSLFVWFSQKYSDAPTTTAVPDQVELDIDSRSIFRAEGTSLAGANAVDFYYWSGTGGVEPTAIDGVKYWNYATDAYVTAGATHPMEEAIAGYAYHRFTNEYASFTRTYSKLMAAAGTDHTSLNILRRTSINDGLATNTYYANKVKKMAESSEVEIEWILE